MVSLATSQEIVVFEPPWPCAEKTPVIGPLPVSVSDGVTCTGIAVNPVALVTEGVILLDD
jgi:hypothetical protein